MGMEEVGTRREALGEYEAILRVLNAKRVELTWKNSAGKSIKTVPKAVRENHADELKDLRQANKDILRMLSAQRDRLDNLFLDERSWKYEDWLQRYIEHPLVGTLGQRLIWSFEKDGETTSGMWREGRVIGSDGSENPVATENSIVKLWHPVGEAVETVVAWRSWVESNEITQPFKQAHRGNLPADRGRREHGIVFQPLCLPYREATPVQRSLCCARDGGIHCV